MAQKQVFCHALPKIQNRFPNNIYDGGIADNYYLWDVGRDIYVRFLNGSTSLQNEVKKISKEWEKYANIKFVFIDHGESHVRIKFNDHFLCASIGVMANMYPQDQANVEIDTSGFKNRETIKGIVLHSFGHIIGLEHESAAPAAGRKWNINNIVINTSADSWDRKKIEHNIIEPYSVSRSNSLIVDDYSIMYNSFPELWTNEKYRPMNTKLSANDTQLIKELYPFNRNRREEKQFFSVEKYISTKVESNDFGFCFYPTFEILIGKARDVQFSILLYDTSGNPIVNSMGRYLVDDQVATSKAPPIFSKRNIRVNASTKDFGLFLPYSEIPSKYYGQKVMVIFRVYIPGIYKEDNVQDFNSTPFYINVPK
jgi:hypothetical protein